MSLPADLSVCVVIVMANVVPFAFGVVAASVSEWVAGVGWGVGVGVGGWGWGGELRVYVCVCL